MPVPVEAHTDLAAAFRAGRLFLDHLPGVPGVCIAPDVEPSRGLMPVLARFADFLDTNAAWIRAALLAVEQELTATRTEKVFIGSQWYSSAALALICMVDEACALVRSNGLPRVLQRLADAVRAEQCEEAERVAGLLMHAATDSGENDDFRFALLAGLAKKPWRWRRAAEIRQAIDRVNLSRLHRRGAQFLDFDQSALAADFLLELTRAADRRHPEGHEPKQSRKRGRPVGTKDPDVARRNKKLCEAWDTGVYQTHAELAREFDVSVDTVRKVIRAHLKAKRQHPLSTR